jgi:ribosomal subunit interface protein
MQIQISAKQVDLADALRQHVETRLTSAVEKYFSSPIEAHVALSRNGQTYRADCTVHVGHGIDAQAHAEAGDVAASVDAAVTRLEKQLRRYKRRLRDHHNRQTIKAQEQQQQLAMAPTFVLAAEPEEGDEPEGFEQVVVAETSTPILTLTAGEAVMHMNLRDLPVLMFRNSAHGGYNVVYRRADGHVGWLDPRPNADKG